MFAATSEMLKLTSGERFLNWLPLDHVGATVPMHLMPVWLGAEQHHVPAAPLLQDILRWFEVIDRFRISFTWAPNFAYGLMVARSQEIAGGSWNLASLRTMVNAGEAVAPDTARKFWRLVAPHGLPPGAIRPSFGMTECGSAITWCEDFSLDQQDDVRRTADLGPPIPGARIRVVDDEGTIVSEGLEGEVQLSGPSVFGGYYKRRDLNEVAFDHGWFRTGDLGLLKRGRLFVTGRKKETIIVNGVHYSCHAIEQAVEALGEVEIGCTAALAVRVDGRDTDAVIIFCVPKEQTKSAGPDLVLRIRAHVVKELGVNADFIVPVQRDEIPKTSIGKIQRQQLKEQFESGAYRRVVDDVRRVVAQQPREVQPALSPVRLERELGHVLAEVLGMDTVSPEANLFDLGATSVQLAQIESRLRSQLGVELTTANVLAYPNIRMLARFLSQQQQAEPIGSVAQIASKRSPRDVRDRRVAIVGMAVRFPGAENVDQFWARLRDGDETITFFSDDELLRAGVDLRLLSDSTYVKAAPLISDHDCFDAQFFGIGGDEADLMDPQHRLFLECAWHTLEHAGYDPAGYPERVGVYASVGFNTYMTQTRMFPDMAGDFTPLLTAAAPDTLPSRVSYKLNLRGPSLAVQTACSGGLVALHLARQALLEGQCEMALAGAASLWVVEPSGYRYHENGLHSPDGHCRAFDARAGGMVFGNGVGAVLLKRFEDAVRDGDTIHAVVLGSAINNDGAGKAGYTAVGMQGQAEAIQQAHEDAGISPETISYVECHGTATVLGDAIELGGLTKAFQQHTRRRSFCAVGSVKTNIGHMGPACGIAGLIKTVEALRRGELPATLHFEQPNPQIAFDQSPFYVNNRHRKWEVNGAVRRAGVSSFGIGGTNAHVVLEEPQVTKAVHPSPRRTQLVLVSARSHGALQTAVDDLRRFVRANGNVDLADIAHTTQVGRKALEHRTLVACTSHDEMLEALGASWHAGCPSAVAPTAAPSLVLRFSEFGGELARMATSLYRDEPRFRELLDEFGDDVRSGVDIDVLECLTLRSGANANSVATGTTDAVVECATLLAIYRLLALWGIQPQAVVGEGTGSYAAAVVAGLIEWKDALDALLQTGHGNPQTSGAIGSGETVYLSPSSGEEISAASGDSASCLLGQQSLGLVDGWFQDFLSQPGRIALTLGGSRYADAVSATVDSAVGKAFFGTVPSADDTTGLHACLGHLWLAGVHVDWQAYQAGRGTRRIPLPLYPFQRQRHWLETTPSHQPARGTAATGSHKVDWRVATNHGRPYPLKAQSLPNWVDGEREALEQQLRIALSSEAPRVLAAHVRRVLLSVMGPAAPESIGDEDHLRDVGLSSVSATSLVAILSATTGTNLPQTLLFDCPTIAAIAGYLARVSTAPPAAEPT